jgi:uncharacterized Fe-S cluster protein YjdI
LLRHARDGILRVHGSATLDPEHPMSDRRLQVYETDQVRVMFDPNVCMHSGVCLRTLPAVFDVRQQRWVRPENASTDDVHRGGLEMSLRRAPSPVGDIRAACRRA